jgi:Zn finger protein HypA/HybF involved in hydrogenase expression
MKIMLPTLKCQRCRHTWTPRQRDVRICPRCKSARWDQTAAESNRATKRAKR